MYNYIVNIYNYLASFFTTAQPLVDETTAQPIVETWQDVYKTIEPALVDLAEKMADLDKLFYTSDGSNEQLEQMFTDITKDFRAIQQIALRVKNMNVLDEEVADRNKKVYDTALYLQQESGIFRHRQQEYLQRSRLY